MEKVFEAALERFVSGSSFPGAPGSAVASGSGLYDGALTPMDEDEPVARPRSKSANRKAVISDDDYSSDDDWLGLKAFVVLYIVVLADIVFHLLTVGTETVATADTSAYLFIF